MKKCVRCQIIYHADARNYCLYCDTQLMDASFDEIFTISAETDALGKMVKSEESITHGRMEQFVSSYFRTKTFSFLYAFNRNEFKISKEFKRFFVQPIDFAVIIKIPWMVIDLVDSLFVRLFYGGFCPECNWKYRNLLSKGHAKQECDYNKEYSSILEQILNGGIVHSEDKFAAEALQKVKEGKRSAYYNLCSRRKTIESLLDISTILASLGLIVFIITKLTMPIFGAIYDF